MVVGETPEADKLVWRFFKKPSEGGRIADAGKAKEPSAFESLERQAGTVGGPEFTRPMLSLQLRHLPLSQVLPTARLDLLTRRDGNPIRAGQDDRVSPPHPRNRFPQESAGQQAATAERVGGIDHQQVKVTG